MIWLWRAYFFLSVLQSSLALALVFQTRSEAGAAVLLGLSPARFLIALATAILAAMFAWLLISTWARQERTSPRLVSFSNQINQPQIWGKLVLILIAIFLLSLHAATLLPGLTEPSTRAYFERLSPLILLVSGLSAQSLAGLLTVRYGQTLFNIKVGSRPFFVSLLILGIMGVAWSWAAQAFMPDESMRRGWNSLGVPLTETQVFLAWGTSLLILWAASLGVAHPEKRGWLRRFKPNTQDIVISLALWLGSIILWHSIPLATNWFVSEERPPNFERYPNSDAFRYDATAQNALAGAGFRYFETPYVRRPGLAQFLTLLHMTAGQVYDRVILAQILVLALISPLIYWLVKSLNNRLSAFIAALLFVLRQTNAISLSSRITTSHVKVLMADLPATLFVVIAAWLMVAWLQRIHRVGVYPLLLGGSLGMAMLIRPESMVFGPVAVILSAVILLPQKQWGAWLKGLVLLALGTGLVTTPWSWRNWKATGTFFFDAHQFGFALISQRFSAGALTPPPPTPTTTHAPEQFPPVSPPAQEESPEQGGENSGSPALATTLSNPGRLAGFILTHYLNSQVQALLVQPSTFRLTDSLVGYLSHRSPERLWEECCSNLGYLRRLPYWHKWDGEFPLQASLPLFVTALLLCTGVAKTWKKHHFAGLAPMLMGVLYLLLNAIFRNSGGRYILPVDWIASVYYSIGIAQFTTWVTSLSGIPLPAFITQETSIPPKESQALVSPSVAKQTSLVKSPRFYLAAFVLLAYGISVPLTELAFKPRYSDADKASMFESLKNSALLTEAQRQQIETYLAQGGTILAGRALYPRFFPNGADELGSHGIWGPPEIPRLSFYLAGPISGTITLPYEKKPGAFPNASDVIVLACFPGELTLQAFAVGILGGNGEPVGFLMTSPPSITCPNPPNSP